MATANRPASPARKNVPDVALVVAVLVVLAVTAAALLVGW